MTALPDGYLPRKARIPVLATDDSVSAAFVTVARECVDHWRAGEFDLLAADRVEALHQMRVGIRRLRSAFALFRGALSDVPGASALTHRLRSLALPFGAARDLDVLLAGPAADSLTPAQRGALGTARDSAYAAVHEILSSAAWRDVRRDVDVFVADAPWGLRLDPPVSATAGAALDRRWERVALEGADLPALSPAQRHAVRIEAKKLRYGCEFFSSLWDADRALAFAATVEMLQSALGELNDAHTREVILTSVGVRPLPIDESALIDAATVAHADLLLLQPFWRDPLPPSHEGP